MENTERPSIVYQDVSQNTSQEEHPLNSLNERTTILLRSLDCKESSSKVGNSLLSTTNPESYSNTISILSIQLC